MATSKRRMRDFQRCLRTIQSFSDNQAQITRWDEEALEWVQVVIQPKDGFYATGRFEFTVFFERDYPKSPPRVDCLTPIYHPNIDSTCEDYNVCLNLFDCWEERFGLEDIIQGLLFLLYNPNIEDPLSPYFDPGMDDDEFRRSVEQSLLGEQIEGVEEAYPRNVSVSAVDNDVLARSIDVILEKASQMLLQEDSEAMDSDSGSVSDGEAPNNPTGEATCLDPPGPGPVAARQDSKPDKTDLISAIGDPADDTNVAMPERTDDYSHGSGNMARYIPRTFITPQPDFLVNAFMACVDIATTCR